MKKISLMISAAIFAVAGFFLAGCEESDDVTEVLAGPTNTWCKMPVTYTSETTNTTTAQTASLYAYFYYTASSVTIKSDLTLEPGLHVVITRNSSDENNDASFISTLTENKYILKSFLKNESSDEDKDNEGTEVKDSDSDSSPIHVNGSRAQWASIYWGKKALRQTTNQSKTAPTEVLNGTEITDLSELKNFSLKRLLAKYLLTLLEEE